MEEIKNINYSPGLFSSKYIQATLAEVCFLFFRYIYIHIYTHIYILNVLGQGKCCLGLGH